MKKSLFMVAGLMLAATLAHGSEGGKREGFWESLSGKLEKITPVKKGVTTTAVGGVRGAKSDEATDIYWKGREKPAEAGEEELQKFSAAVESRMKGDGQQALKQFEEFLSDYPQSDFRVEALQAVERLRQEMAAPQAPAQAAPAK